MIIIFLRHTGIAKKTILEVVVYPQNKVFAALNLKNTSMDINV